MSNKDNQHLHSKFLLIFGSNSSNTTFLSTHINLNMFNFSQASQFFSNRNLSLLKAGVEVEVVFLLALVFLTIMLREGKERPKQKQKKQRKPRADCIRQGQRDKQQQKISIYMMHEQNEQMMHALMHCKQSTYTLKTSNDSNL